MQVLRGGGTIDAYVENNIITEVQLLHIKAYLFEHYPKIDFYPLAQELQPLISLAQHIVIAENKRLASILEKQRPFQSYIPSQYEADYWNAGWSEF